MQQQAHQAPAAKNVTLEAALREAEERYVAANPKSRARIEAASANLPGGNTRSVLHYSPFPVTITKGEGCHLTDLDGHRYTDFLGEYTAGLYGHSHPVIMRAVREALEAGVVLGGPNRWEGELARLVCERFPSVELVRFTNSGTEANMMNMVTARAHTGRTPVMAFNGGYHGGGFYFPPGGSPINAPFPFVMADYNDAESTRALIGRHAGDLAAIVVEPMMGGGGGIPADREFLQMLRDEATRHGIVLIFDEVMTSRTAPGGIQGKLGIRPDLTSFGKYIGGGMSFGAFGGRRELMERYDPRRPDAWRHAGTFNNNVLTMSAGVAGLREVYTPEEAERLTARGDRLREELNELGRRYGVPVQATGVGSIMSVHFQERPIRRPADTAATPEAARALLHLELLARGYYIARRGFIALNVMLEDEHYEGFKAAFGEFLEANRSVLAG